MCSSGMPYAVQGSLERQLVVGGVAGQWSSGSWAADRELETAARQQCVGQDNNGSFKLVRSEKGSERLSGVPLDVCCKCL